MSKLSPLQTTISAIVIGLVVIFIFIGTIPLNNSVPNGENQDQFDEANEPNKENDSGFNVAGLLRTVLDFLNEYSAAIAALATTAIAIFTFTLWRTNKRLWGTAVDQSEKMKASIEEAKKSAIAMEVVA